MAGPWLSLGVALGGVALGLRPRGPELVLTVRRTGVDADLRALPAVPKPPSAGGNGPPKGPGNGRKAPWNGP